jgi:hypothetical protein
MANHIYSDLNCFTLNYFLDYRMQSTGGPKLIKIMNLVVQFLVLVKILYTPQKIMGLLKEYISLLAKHSALELKIFLTLLIQFQVVLS